MVKRAKIKLEQNFPCIQYLEWKFQWHNMNKVMWKNLVFNRAEIDLQLTEEELQKIKRDVLQKAVDGMREEGRPYIGRSYKQIFTIIVWLKYRRLWRCVLLSYFIIP